MIKILLAEHDSSRIDQFLTQLSGVRALTIAVKCAPDAVARMTNHEFDLIVIGDSPDRWTGIYPKLYHQRGQVVVTAHDIRVPRLVRIAKPKSLYCPFCDAMTIIVRDIAANLAAKFDATHNVQTLSINQILCMILPSFPYLDRDGRTSA